MKTTVGIHAETHRRFLPCLETSC